jgi:hypothetical protein
VALAAADTISPGATRSGLIRPSGVGPKLEKLAMTSTRFFESAALRKETCSAEVFFFSISKRTETNKSPVLFGTDA